MKILLILILLTIAMSSRRYRRWLQSSHNTDKALEILHGMDKKEIQQVDFGFYKKFSKMDNDYKKVHSNAHTYPYRFKNYQVLRQIIDFILNSRLSTNDSTIKKSEISEDLENLKDKIITVLSKESNYEKLWDLVKNFNTGEKKD